MRQPNHERGVYDEAYVSRFVEPCRDFPDFDRVESIDESQNEGVGQDEENMRELQTIAVDIIETCLKILYHIGKKLNIAFLHKCSVLKLETRFCIIDNNIVTYFKLTKQ